MTPKPRNKENRELPARWRLKHGAYFYRVPEHSRDLWDGKIEFRLGKTLHEAYMTFASRVEDTGDIRTLGQLLDRYAVEVVPGNKPKTQESKHLAIRRLRPVFGDMPVAEVKPRHAYKYMDLVTRKHGATSANRDFEVLSHAMSKAVVWGLIDFNQLKGQVKKNKTRPRKRYIEDWEIDELRAVAHPTIRAYVRLKQLVGLRCSDMLRLKTTDMLKEGLYVDTGKTEAKLLITWTDELRTAIEFALSVRPADDTDLVFCTRRGECYATPNGKNSGFKSLWQRSMAKALKSTKLKHKFTEKDIRAKTASDMDSTEDAQKLLGHTSPETTRRHYRLKPEKVAPHSLKNNED
jgi:integrase